MDKSKRGLTPNLDKIKSKASIESINSMKKFEKFLDKYHGETLRRLGKE